MSEDQLSRAIDQVSGQMGVSVDASTKEKVIDMLMKVKNTDVDVADLASQAAGLYSKISGTMKELNIQPREAAGFLEKLLRWALDLLHSFGIGQ
jgi:predicted ATP-grasp superfamily ATP-dependent carboligase